MISQHILLHSNFSFFISCFFVFCLHTEWTRFDTFCCCSPRKLCTFGLFVFCVNWFWLLSIALLLNENLGEYVPIISPLYDVDPCLNLLSCYHMDPCVPFFFFLSLCNQIFCEIQYFVCFGFVNGFFHLNVLYGFYHLYFCCMLLVFGII